MQKKAIVVEDDPGIQDILKLILEAGDYDTVIFPTGNKLLSSVFDPPDIFIIDKRLPGIDGLDVCTHLKKSQATADIPVIILSATPHIEKLAAKAGADAFIEKPFSKDHLLKTIASLIENKNIVSKKY
jgi:DNA-binding response OmpR family regulator